MNKVMKIVGWLGFLGGSYQAIVTTYHAQGWHAALMAIIALAAAHNGVSPTVSNLSK